VGYVDSVLIFIGGIRLRAVKTRERTKLPCN
jgi:hypothetical protein